MAIGIITGLLVGLLAVLFVQQEVLSTEAAEGLVAMPGCNSSCGSLSRIPYPFGVKEGCYLNRQFLITCNYSYDPPRAFLMNSKTVEVLNISIAGDLNVNGLVARDCYGSYSNMSNGWAFLDLVSKFTISESRNKFTVLGCDSYGYLDGYLLNTRSGQRNGYTSGCSTVCDYNASVDANSCTGSGCCQVAIPPGLVFTNTSALSFKKHRDVLGFNPCTYAFIVEDGRFDYNFSYLKNMPKRMPIVLEWAIQDSTKTWSSSSTICKGKATSFPAKNNLGYRCQCNDGYQGNPYLDGGCQGVLDSS
ncbi:hypothetical protein Tsubulata_017804 [Turnera subulata]|uniref:Wall-associated receptor kinase galacturonan-binding domain-containing protein n=1 Tax=Turnera subulata TaxID=218843 RepID=A0A9Q0FXE1_9ROSI|nr:hypothetical protein Tsubulata_017804 [Turnera subulata]